jgi:hypothetical protein
VSCLHLPSHLDHIGGKARDVAGQLEDRRTLALEGGTNFGIAGDITCARQRLMLPRPRRFALILFERGEARDQQAGRAVRTEAKIGVVEPSRCRRAGEPRIEPLREARVSLRRDIGIRRARLDIVQEHQVEVRNVPELLATELAVANHGEARRHAGLLHLRPTTCKRRGENDIRERRQMIGESFDAETSTQVLREQP